MSEPPILPVSLYRAEQVRKMDQIAIQQFGIAGIRLMRRAGEGAFEKLMELWPNTSAISIWCGSGNNAGDGYIVAGLAARRGVQVQLVQVGADEKLQGDAKRARDWAEAEGVQFTPFLTKEARQEETLIIGDLVVDALLGTGLAGSVQGRYENAIKQINDSGLPVIAVDIPSGLCSDSGSVLGAAVYAQATISFIGLKRGLLTGDGPAHCGELYYDDLDVPKEVHSAQEAGVERIDITGLRKLPARRRNAHKGDFGRVLVVGGNLGMGGAALMAAQAAGRCGAGLVSLATRPEHMSAAIARCPEVMVHGVNSGQDLEPLLDAVDVIVIGPGLGQTAWSEQLFRAVLEVDKTLVVDADALNMIAAGTVNHCRRDNWILTPHPGEAGRLLEEDTSLVQQDRFAAVRRLQQRYSGVAILKGAGSLICDGSSPAVSLCSAGNPGMATGGMGDILSGVLGAMLAQGIGIAESGRFGVCLHAAAADRAAAAGERGMQATDLLPHLRRLVNSG